VKRTVTLSALIKRINRKLAHEGEAFRTSRGKYPPTDLGRYYILNIHHNSLVAGDCDPKNLGRELGVLGTWEAVVEDA
jgi:hypothetical protein